MSGCARAYAADRAEFVIIIIITIIIFTIIIIIIMTIIIIIIIIIIWRVVDVPKMPPCQQWGKRAAPKASAPKLAHSRKTLA